MACCAGLLERRAAEHDLSLIQTRLPGVLRDRTPTMNELARFLGLDKSRRCRPGRGGDAHHPRRPFAAVLLLGAFIGVASCGRGAGHPITYKCDIILIS